MIAKTATRVEEHTPARINERIRRRTAADIARYLQSGPGEVRGRLDELDREWDMERVLEANASTLALTGVLLGAFVDRRWLLLPAAVAGFLLQHALQGWCPPLTFFRRRGFRTAREIEGERHVLMSRLGAREA